MHSLLLKHALVILLLASIAGGCDPVDPMQTPAGDYASTLIIIYPPGPGPDTLSAHGFSITMTLRTDNTVSGHILIPASSGSNVDSTIHGTWSVRGDSVFFQTNQIYWIDACTWRASNNELNTIPESFSTIALKRR